MQTKQNLREFLSSLENMKIAHNGDQLSIVEQVALDSIYGLVKNFMGDNNLVQPDHLGSLEDLNAPITKLNAMSTVGFDQNSLLDLCTSCNVPTQHIRSCMESLALCIHNYTNNYDVGTHFSKGAPSSHVGDGFEIRGFGDMYSDRAVNAINAEQVASMESFGADVSNVISDAKVAITVTILRYHRGALHRLIPNIPTDTSMVTYKVSHMEVYDLTKSRSSDGAVRVEGAHRIPFVELYGDPSPANTKLKPIVMRVENDQAAPNNKLLEENIVKIGARVNMFSLALDAGTIGYQHTDYTDIVADNVRIKSLRFSVTDGTNTELFDIPVSEYSGARMMMSPNNNDSGDRSCVMHDILTLDSTSKTSDGAASVLLAGFTSDAFIRISLDASGNVNLKTSELVVLASAVNSIATVSGLEAIPADKTLFGTLTINVIGCEPDAEFSEENVRKSTKAMRIMGKQVGYELPGSQNFMVNYSLTQTRPETVIDGLAKLMALGNDDRGVKLIMDTMGNVYNRIKAESKLVNDNYVNKIGQAFAAGLRVKPYIYMDTLQIDATLANMRSGDKWGDIRALAEEFLLNVFSRLYRMSYYAAELGDGEKPVFNCLTSIPIKSSLLSVPHYHNHLKDTNADKVADGAVEFRRTLPDGTIMNVLTSTFNYLDDKIIIVPVRPARPQSVLNFGQNRERGQFLAQATPTVNDALFNTLIANSREFPIITNPVGAIIQVSGLHQIFDTLGTLGI